jgi:hypothetical protein
MVANSKTTPTPSTEATWGNDTVETLAGLNLIEKPNLKGVPFLITGYKFTYNESRKISYVYVEFETKPGGEREMFNDSSANGVRLEVEEFHNAKNPGKPFELDRWYDTRILCPGGLRDSEYDVPGGDERGRPARGRSFYLTRSGGRS